MAGSFQGKFLDRCRKSFRRNKIGRQKVFLSGAARAAIAGNAVAVGIDGTGGGGMARATISWDTSLCQGLPMAASASAANPYSLFNI